ncbi:cytochrome c oxidase subunit 3 [Rhodovibrio salinarum]|uniref:Cytochrome c oxidase subunit 3 n=1 Tax=Rhodovibrio salinarum TaxID=1087 RepID=A0A934UZS7_9PROT|nr:cytochrome c oxidase subunit 3 [Rhodovibrio salinarum]MBK1696719.1 cytochrome c oxidase subunit 3 [Rhodovibrio salinarum]
MAHTHEKNHPYHMVDPSPWPLVGALSAGVLALGLVFWMHDSGLWLAFVGLAMVLLTMAGWWRQVIRESRAGDHTPVVKLGLRYGMLLFIASEVMFFAAFFWAYFNGALFPTDAISGTWPPPEIHTFDAFSIPFLNTLILLLSGCTVTWAHHALREGDRSGMLRGLALTVFLGMIFTSLQAYEYAHAHFGFGGDIYSSVFYMATGFHGFHVIIGTIFLLVCFFRARAGHFTPESHFGFEAAAWYWHFVDVVWLFLFSAVYWWGS